MFFQGVITPMEHTEECKSMVLRSPQEGAERGWLVLWERGPAAGYRYRRVGLVPSSGSVESTGSGVRVSESWGKPKGGWCHHLKPTDPVFSFLSEVKGGIVAALPDSEAEPFKSPFGSPAHL